MGMTNKKGGKNIRVSRAFVKNRVKMAVAGNDKMVPQKSSRPVDDTPRRARPIKVVTQAKPKEMNSEYKVSLARRGLEKFLRLGKIGVVLAENMQVISLYIN